MAGPPVPLAPWAAVLLLAVLMVINGGLWLARRHKVCHSAMKAGCSPGTARAPVSSSKRPRVWLRCSASAPPGSPYSVTREPVQMVVTGSRRQRLAAELAYLRREAAKLNNPSTFAKCSKLQARRSQARQAPSTILVCCCVVIANRRCSAGPAQRLAALKEKELAELRSDPAVPTVPDRLLKLGGAAKVGQAGSLALLLGLACRHAAVRVCRETSLASPRRRSSSPRQRCSCGHRLSRRYHGTSSLRLGASWRFRTARRLSALAAWRWGHGSFSPTSRPQLLRERPCRCRQKMDLVQL
jgi:hypothetical protein